MTSVYVADFETTQRGEYACVWLFSIVNIFDRNEIYFGTSIEEFIKLIYDISPKTIFFHNVKFDGIYILDYLMRNGYEHTIERRLKKNEFSTLIGEEGQFYSLSFMGSKGKIQIWDSLKIFNFSAEEIANSFELETKKGSIDYKKYRPDGYIPTQDEYDYVRDDVIIIAEALEIFINDGYTKMTIASNALAKFKSTLEKGEFNYYFPALDANVDGFCRKSYKGGFTYVNPRYQNIDIGKGCVYDMNSMYPYTLYYLPMPVGVPEYFAGSPNWNKLFIIHIHIDRFELKENHIPTIQIKGSFMYSETDYLTEGTDVDLHLTSVDYKLFLDHYNTHGLVEIGGYYFQSKAGLFCKYIDEFMEIKMNTKGGRRQIAKLFLNGLYGKFGAKIDRKRKIPYMEDGVVKFRKTPPEQSKPVYVPLAAFVTSYARDNIIRNAQKVYDRFIYCDTDSLHLVGWDMPNIPIDDTKLGYYKNEGLFTFARFIRPKTYIEEVEEKLSVKCCGMNKEIARTKVTKDNFVEGMVYDGKLKPKIIKGGVILEEVTFTIKKSKPLDKKDNLCYNINEDNVELLDVV